MLQHNSSGWTFLTNHAQVMLCIADDAGIRVREIGERVGITERAAHRIVAQLVAAGYISRERTGRRNRYTIHADLTLPDPIGRERVSSTSNRMEVERTDGRLARVQRGWQDGVLDDDDYREQRRQLLEDRQVARAALKEAVAEGAAT